MLVLGTFLDHFLINMQIRYDLAVVTNLHSFDIFYRKLG